MYPRNIEIRRHLSGTPDGIPPHQDEQQSGEDPQPKEATLLLVLRARTVVMRECYNTRYGLHESCIQSCATLLW